VGSWFDDNVRRFVGDGCTTLFWFDNWVGERPLRLQFPRLFDLAIIKEYTVEKVERLGWEVGGGGWEWRRQLLAWGEESVRECFEELHNIVLQVDVTDKWRWLLDHVHGYSVRESYRFITNSGAQVDRSLVNDVWHRLIPEKVSLLVWPRGTHSFFKVIWVACVWVIWKDRNDRIFNNTENNPLVLIEKVKLFSFL